MKLFRPRGDDYRTVTPVPAPLPVRPVYHPERPEHPVTAYAAARVLFGTEPTDRALAGWLPPQAIEEGAR